MSPETRMIFEKRREVQYHVENFFAAQKIQPNLEPVDIELFDRLNL